MVIEANDNDVSNNFIMMILCLRVVRKYKEKQMDGRKDMRSEYISDRNNINNETTLRERQEKWLEFLLLERPWVYVAFVIIIVVVRSPQWNATINCGRENG